MMPKLKIQISGFSGAINEQRYFVALGREVYKVKKKKVLGAEGLMQGGIGQAWVP